MQHSSRGRPRKWRDNAEKNRNWYYRNRKKILAFRRENKVWSLYRDKKMGVIRPKQVKCHLCDKPISGSNLCSDHNHETGRFRGWLCKACNRSLGWFERRKGRILRYIR